MTFLRMGVKVQKTRSKKER